jgi:membrane protease YdiL (CAAX protease family)
MVAPDWSWPVLVHRHSACIFSFGRWSGGVANILIAFATGLILTRLYLWRRDLTANMIGHGLLDFVVNVLPALFA